MDNIKNKFKGSMLGTFIGDALGMPVEGKSYSYIEKQYGKIDTMLEARMGKGTYTDDTQLMISLAESLIENRGFKGEKLAGNFLNNYNPKRGYGRGTSTALKYIKEGVRWNKVGEKVFQGGSFGNGSAMRIAPVGLLYYDNIKKLKEISYKSSTITHSHPLGKEGAAIMAKAIGSLVGQDFFKFNSLIYLEELINFSSSRKFSQKLLWIKENINKNNTKDTIIHNLGIGSQSFNSVPTAIYIFLENFHSFKKTVINAIGLGGDTDTIGAMSGALSGALLGYKEIPKQWLQGLENTSKGRDYVITLAKKLYNLKCELDKKGEI